MKYTTYLAVSVFSAAFWVVSISLCGYFFGNMPFVKNNFTIFIIVVVLATIIPSLIIAYKDRKQSKNKIKNSDKTEIDNKNKNKNKSK